MIENIEWKVRFFTELSIDELYALLHLRAKVFVVEQDSPYLDADFKDQKALHLLGYMAGRLVAYCRLFRAGDYFPEAAIGRVVLAAEYRRLGVGHLLMEKALALLLARFGETEVTISAQEYLQAFYESHGFVCSSDVYFEDRLPHRQMKRASCF